MQTLHISQKQLIISTENWQKVYVFTHHFVALIFIPLLSDMSQMKALDLLFNEMLLVIFYILYKEEQDAD